MEDRTLDSFEKWADVQDYSSDETTVDLIDDKGEVIAKFNYPRFTAADFIYYKAMHEVRSKLKNKK